MARTCTTPQRNLIAATSVNHYIQVKVANPDGVMTDVSQYVGVDWLDSAQWGEELDTPVSSATLTLRRDTNTYSLSPLMSGSLANRNGGGSYAPFLEKGRAIQIFTAVTAPNTAPVAGDWKLMFSGRIDKIAWASNPVTIECSDLGAWIADAWIRDSIHTYFPIAAPGSGVLLGTGIQNMLNAWPIYGSPITLYQPVTAAWQPNGPAPQPAGSMLEAIRSLAQAIGWECRYRFDSSDNYRLTLYQPPRSNVTPDWIIGPTEYRSVTQLEGKIDNIRNVIYGEFSDGTTYYGEGGGAPARQATDSSSIAKYGERFMGIKSKIIQTTADMDALLAAVLSDLSEADVDQTIELPYFWPVQLGDIIQFSPNADHYDSAQTLAVVGFQHSFQNGEGSTTISVRGKPAGAYKAWLNYSAVVESAPAAGPPTCWITADTAGATDTSIDVTFNGQVGAGGTLLQWQYSVNHGAYSALSSAALPQVFTVTRQAKAEVVIVLKVVQADGQTFSSSYVVPGKMVAMNRGDGSIDRGVPWHDGKYGLKADDTSGNTASSTVGDSRGGSLLNNHFRISSTDTTDQITEGSGTPLTGGKRGFLALNSGNRLVTAVDETASIGQESAVALSKRAGIFFSETFNALPSSSSYSNSGAGTMSLVTDLSNTSVGKFLLQSGGSQPQVWIVFNGYLPFNPSKLYRLRSRVRCTIDGTGVLYFGFQGLKADQATYANTNGGYQYMHYSGEQITVSQGWVEKTTWVKGATVDGSAGFGGGQSTDPTAPGAINLNTAFVRPLIAMGYPGGSGSSPCTYQCDYFQIDELDEDGSLRTYTVLDAGTSLGRLRSGAADSRGSAVNGMYRYGVDDAGGVVVTTTRQFYDPTSAFSNPVRIIAGSNSPVTNALVSAVNSGNGIEFGHANASGYRSTLGADNSSGNPFLAFNAEAGTTSNTYKTRGIVGSVLRSDLSGGFGFFKVANANADNQSLTSLMALDASGNLTPGGFVNAQGSSYQLNGVTLAQRVTNYHILYDYGGTQALHLGGGADANNYYSNSAHVFRSRTGAAVYGIWDVNGIIAGNNSTTTPLKLVGGAGVPFNIGASGGNYPCAGYNMSPNGGTGFTYSATDAASYIMYYAGGFRFYGANSGTAGSAMSPSLLAELYPTGNINIAGAYQIGGLTVVAPSGNYFVFNDPGGTNCFYAGNASDPSNYYANTTHYFKSRTSASTFAQLNSSLFAVNVPLQCNNSISLSSSGTHFIDAFGHNMVAVVTSSSTPTGSAEIGTIWIQY